MILINIKNYDDNDNNDNNNNNDNDNYNNNNNNNNNNNYTAGYTPQKIIIPLGINTFLLYRWVYKKNFSRKLDIFWLICMMRLK